MHKVFKDTGLVVVAHNNGMVAAQSAEFRKKVKEAGGTVKVVKNNLAKLALKDTPFAELIGLFKGPTLVAYSKDPIAAAKAANAYAKTNDKLVIIGGAMGSTVLDAKGVKALADLPSLDELRAKLVGLLNAPATKLVRTLQEPGGQLVRVIHAKAGSGGAAAEEAAAPAAG